MKKNKIIALFVFPLVLLSSCANRMENYDPHIVEMIDEAEFKAFSSNSKCSAFIRTDNKKDILFYTELFGTSNEDSFMIQYDYTYTYKGNKDLPSEVKEDIYELINLKYSDIASYYPSLNYTFDKVYENNKIITREVIINNETKEDVSIVTIDYYVPFCIRYNSSGTVYYFALPMQTKEYKKVGSDIINENGEKENFTNFMETHNILKK